MARKQTSSNFENRKFLAEDCAINQALEHISGRWKMQILYLVNSKMNRFSLIKSRLIGISDRMLGLRMSELIALGLLKKRGAPKEEHYVLTVKAESLLKILDDLVHWQGSKSGR